MIFVWVQLHSLSFLNHCNSVSATFSSLIKIFQIFKPIQNEVLPSAEFATGIKRDHIKIHLIKKGQEETLMTFF